MRNRTKWLVCFFTMLLSVAVILPAAADWGCFNCVTDYNDCQGLAGLCSQKCEQVGHNEQGEAIQCSQVEAWPGPGGRACWLDGDACVHTEVNDNQDPPGPGNWCPEGEACS